MEEWHGRTRANHISRNHRRRHLYAYLDWYNQVRVHQSLESTSLERLERYFKISTTLDGRTTEVDNQYPNQDIYVKLVKNFIRILVVFLKNLPLTSTKGRGVC